MLSKPGTGVPCSDTNAPKQDDFANFTSLELKSLVELNRRLLQDVMLSLMTMAISFKLTLKVSIALGIVCSKSFKV